MPVRFASFVFVVALTACAGGGGETGRDSRAGSQGVTVALPAGWHTMEARDGNVIDPVTRVAVSSSPMRHRGTACQVANYGPEPDAVAVVILEWKPYGGSRSGNRPDWFGPDVLPVERRTIECFDGSGGSAQLVEHGRSFGAYVLLGRDAPPELADEARAVLETLTVDRP